MVPQVCLRGFIVRSVWVVHCPALRDAPTRACIDPVESSPRYCSQKVSVDTWPGERQRGISDSATPLLRQPQVVWVMRVVVYCGNIINLWKQNTIFLSFFQGVQAAVILKHICISYLALSGSIVLTHPILGSERRSDRSIAWPPRNPWWVGAFDDLANLARKNPAIHDLITIWSWFD